MIRKLKNIAWSVLRKLNLGGILQLVLASALIDDGWFRSFNQKESVDKNGNPIPWYTYSAIKFIEGRLKPEFDIFEYGCGNSTRWFAKRVNSVHATEHDSKWMEKVSLKLPGNAKVFHFEVGDNYVESIQKLNKKFHIIVVDGMERNECVKYCVDHLKENGIIIFDNTQLEDYEEGISFLVRRGFKRLDFIGILPIVGYNNTTSIFYRESNCLEI